MICPREAVLLDSRWEAGLPCLQGSDLSLHLTFAFLFLHFWEAFTPIVGCPIRSKTSPSPSPRDGADHTFVLRSPDGACQWAFISAMPNEVANNEWAEALKWVSQQVRVEWWLCRELGGYSGGRNRHCGKVNTRTFAALDLLGIPGEL